jgi:hypothetical protein
LLSISTAAFAKVGEKRGTCSGIVINPRIRSIQTARCPLSVDRRAPVSHHAFFEHFRISSREKNMVFPAGFDPTEDSPDEKDGSLADCNAGASERRIDLFLCRRRRSDAPVLSRTLRRQVSRKPRKLKI